MKEYKYKIKGVDYDVKINDIEENIAKVEVNGIEFEVELEKPIAAPKPVIRPVVAPVKTIDAPKPAETAKTPAGTYAVKAPLPGTIVEIKVAVGATVKRGDTVVILEAMKMEIPVVAPEAGTIASIDVAVGDAIESGAVLATLN